MQVVQQGTGDAACLLRMPSAVSISLPFPNLTQVMKHIHYEDENTRYIDIGPVNKVINMLCCWFEDPDSTAFKK
jgi:hypothetical protein